MAQACNLLYSDSDSDRFPLDSVPIRDPEQINREFQKTYRMPVSPLAPSKPLLLQDAATSVAVAKAWGVHKTELQQFEQRRGDMPSNARHFLTELGHGNLRLQRDLIRGLGNLRLDSTLAVKTADALRQMSDQMHRLPAGIATGAGWKGRAWVSRLKSQAPGQANGAAAEVLFAAKVLRGEANWKPAPDGRCLEVDLGVKQQASYGHQRELRVTDFETHSIFRQPASSTGNASLPRQTVEADALVSITRGAAEPQHRVSFDFKYRSTGTAEVTSSQIDGVVSGLQLGEMEEASRLGPVRVGRRPPTPGDRDLRAFVLPCPA